MSESEPIHWTRESRAQRIARLKREVVPAPSVLYTRVAHGETFDVVWDGSIRNGAAEPTRVDC